MNVIKRAIAGTMESSDIQVTIEPAKGSGQIDITLKSSVEKQFGRQIRAVITETLNNLGVTEGKVIAIDKGALDCTIKARVKAAAYRAAEETEAFNWEV